jgi:imidazolonepropionase-like amidohydrolase
MVTAHIFALSDAKGLLRAGLDAFAHSVRDQDVDDEFITLVQERPDFVLVPNLPGPGIASDLSWLSGTVPAEQLAAMQERATDNPRAQASFGIQARNLVRMSEAGVRIAFGTDGGSPWAVHQEIEDMVTAGLTPSEAIVAATSTSAEFLGLSDIGTLTTGRSADFIVLDANPLDDITNTRRIASVYLRGTEVDRAAISARLLAAGGS